LYPPCETVSRYVLPLFRSLVARELIEKHSFTQMEAAKKLGTTQAAISQYLHSKRGTKATTQFEHVLSVQEAAAQVANRIVTENIESGEVMAIFCRLCMSLRQEPKPSLGDPRTGSSK